MSKQKRVLAVHDISCIGKCSLTVALPIISAGGAECCVIPTAVLSTHTGGFENFTFRDLTEDILPIVNHWKTLDFKFDGIYTGYLGSFEQVEIVGKVIDELKSENTLVVVDPVMADNGSLYKNFDESFPREMVKICSKADVIIPNITEACLLTNTPYKEGPYDKEYIALLIEKLKKICDKKIVLTGVYFDEENLGCACFENGNISYCFAQRQEGMFHGTGDVFGSVLVSALMKGKPLLNSAEIAVCITTEAIKETKADLDDQGYGVRFESQLLKLIELLK